MLLAVAVAVVVAAALRARGGEAVGDEAFLMGDLVVGSALVQWAAWVGSL